MPIRVESCPVCGARDSHSTGPQVPGLTAIARGQEFRQPPYSVRECSTCGLLYKDNTASPTELSDYYMCADFRKWEIHGYFPTERAILDLLRTMPKGSRYLDFGCSSGRLLAPLAADYDCSGLEINEMAASEAAGKGLKILPADFVERQNTSEFDAVTIVDVFEHLQSPLEVLRKLYDLIRPDGLLLIVTGNGDSTACRLAPAQFWYFRNVEHLCMLSRRSAECFSHELGAKLEYWQGMSHYDARLYKRLKQTAQHFSYWQFRRRTFLSRTILPLLPLLNRARNWPLAPAYDTSSDHVLLGLRKP